MWHVDFVKILIANICVCTSLYMFFPALPGAGLMPESGLVGVGVSVLAFCAGMCLPAPFCSYWLDRYRRKSVALWALFGLVGVTSLWGGGLSGWEVYGVRLAQGAFYGMFQIAVGSTLLLDLSDTRRRTEAAHVYYWFTRFALVLGLSAGWILSVYYGPRLFAGVAVGLLLCAGVFLWAVRVPFRAPLEPSWCTLDRFWLPRGFRIFLPLCGVCLAAGMMMARYREVDFYLFLAVGFWLALGLHRSLLRDRLQGEILLGYVCLAGAALWSWLQDGTGGGYWSTAMLLGCGLGFVTSRYLLSYIRICEHCERGTAQTSYLLGWDMGLWAGYAGASALWGKGDGGDTYYIIGGLFLVTGLFHGVAVRPWYARNKRK